jgi:ABC-2 type transport system permease protein
MRLFHDTITMTKRSVRHTVRSVDTIITVAVMPIAMMLLFVYVIGATIQTGDISYIDFITPGILVMCIASGIAYAAVRLNNDMTKGMVNRFRTMPIASSSVLGGHAVSSVVSNLVSVALVILVALLAGFRSDAGVVSLLGAAGLLVLFTIATSWLAIVFGLLAKSAEGAGAFSYILLLLIFTSSAFATTDSMGSAVRAFAENQPMTLIIETMRSFLVNDSAGSDAWAAVGWCLALFAVSYFAAVKLYTNKAG